MRIPISIESVRNKNAEAKALIDSGAAGYFIDWGFVRKKSYSHLLHSEPNPSQERRRHSKQIRQYYESM